MRPGYRTAADSLLSGASNETACRNVVVDMPRAWKAVVAALALALVVAGVSAEWTEPNDSFDMAGPVALNDDHVETLYPVGDVDFLRFDVVTTPMPMTITL